MDPRKREKPTIPIIPRPINANHDASSVLREVFHDILEEPTIPENILQNWATFKVDSGVDALTANKINQVIEQSKLEIEALQIVEKKLALNAVAFQRECEELSNADTVKKDLQKLRRPSIFPQIDQTDVKEYGLITSQDLLPTKFYQKLDFTYDKRQVKPTQKGSAKGHILRKEPLRSRTTKMDTSRQNLVQQKKHSSKLKISSNIGDTKDPGKRKIKDKSKILPPIIKPQPSNKDFSTQSDYSSGTSQLIRLPPKLCFDKEEVTFKDYQLNKTYKQRFRLQNISPVTQQIIIPMSSVHGFFTVQPALCPQSLKLYPGMSITFTVYFKTNIYLDIEKEFVTNGCGIKFVCCREMPSLIAFLIRGRWKPKMNSKIDFVRAEALNNTIDCGTCLIGEQLNVYMIVTNIGGPGTFFFMTEEQWFTQDINSMNEDLKLDFGEFSISPNYFHLEKEEFIVLQIDFYGSKSDTFVDNLNLVCDNMTWESLDFVADVIIFDEYSVTCDTSNLLTAFKYIFEDTPIVSTIDENDSYSTIIKQSNISHSLISVKSFTTKTDLSDSIKDDINTPSEISFQSTTDAKATSSGDCIDELIFEYLLRMEKQKSRMRANQNAEEGPTAQPSDIFYLGKTLCNQDISKDLEIQNNTNVSLKFRWEPVLFDKKDYPHITIYDMDLDQINFEHKGFKNTLAPYQKLEFRVNVKPQQTEEAFYAATAKFIIEDVPECAVRLSKTNKQFTVLDRRQISKNMNVVDVQVLQINLVCFVVGLRMLITPRNIFGSFRYNHGTHIKREFMLTVDCDHSTMMAGRWESNKYDDQRVFVEPEVFKIFPRVPFEFEAYIYISSYDSSMEKITVSIADEYFRTIELPIRVEPPHLKFNRRVLNMGLLTINNVYQRCFKMINRNNIRMKWEIREQFKSDMDPTKKNEVSLTARNLDCGDVEILYEVRAMVPSDWNSDLILYSYWGNKRSEECRMTVQYEITNGTVDVLLHTQYSQCAILSPPEALNLGIPHTYTVCFHSSMRSSVAFEYTGSYGNDADQVKITVAPCSFSIPGSGSCQIGVTITPLKSGILDNIFMDFSYNDRNPYRSSDFIQPSPTVLTVMVAVDDIFVRVILPPDKDGRQKEVLWPPCIAESYDQSTTETSDDFLAMAPPEEDYEKLVFPRNYEEENGMHMEMDMSVLPPDLVHYLKSLEPQYFQTEASSMVKLDSTISSFSSDTTVSTPSSCRYSAYGFENMSEHIIKICNVPQRKLHNFSIKLENRSPILGEITITAQNFPAKDYTPTKFDNVLKNLHYTTDEAIYEKRVGPHGILIDHNFEDGKLELPPYGVSEVVVTVYANTWGTYKEDLIIDINNVLPLKISALIEVVGIPLEFPIGINNIHKTAILRFGTLSYQSNFEIRRLQVRNTSVIPVNVVWHVFMRHSHEERANEPITVIFDVFHPDDDDGHEEEQTVQGNLMILHGKCVGRSDHRIFKLNPREMQIPPQETSTIKIGVNAKSFIASYDRKDIEAYLIGYLHLPYHDRCNPLLFQRPTGHDNDPAKAKITACLDLPILTLDMMDDDLRFAFFADRVIAAGRTKEILHLTFKNLHATQADVRFFMDPPFALEPRPGTNITMEINDEGQRWFKAEIIPSDCAQLTVSYTLHPKDIARMVKCLFDDSTEDVEYYSGMDFNTSTFTLVKYLHIEQRGFLRQTVELTVRVYFPHLEFSNQLEFGMVYIGNVAKLVCTVKNYSSCRVELTLQDCDFFRTTTKHGVIEPGRRDFPMFYDLVFIFIPQMQTKFEEEIVITTQIPGLNYKIKLSGIGTHNEKYYKPDCC